jgi:HSP20 family molecular chaperone IbpA
MSDIFQSHLEHLERQLRTLAGEFTRVQTVRFSAAPCWSPAINVYRCPDRFIICLDLAGVERQHLSVQAEPRRVRISGHRSPPEPRLNSPQPVQVLAMEIDYGHFEREVRLPETIDAACANAEQRDGWLWIHLPLEVRP